jgi:hypothetical protein
MGGLFPPHGDSRWCESSHCDARWHVNSLELRPFGTWEVCSHCGQLHQRRAFRGGIGMRCVTCHGGGASLGGTRDIQAAVALQAFVKEHPPSVRAPVTLSRVRAGESRTRRRHGRGMCSLLIGRQYWWLGRCSMFNDRVPAASKQPGAEKDRRHPFCELCSAASRAP